MHPLSIFPQLFTYGLVAPLLLRLTAGIFIMKLGRDLYKKTNIWLGVTHMIPGILLILGLYTQPAVIVALFLIGFDYYTEKKSSSFSEDKNILYTTIGVILLSLLFTGPGFLAFDLPL